MTRMVPGAAFALVAAALAFGATQSIAAPAPSAALNTCDAVECDASCLLEPCAVRGVCTRHGDCFCEYEPCREAS
jgi:hypothetical protein